MCAQRATPSDFRLACSHWDFTRHQFTNTPFIHLGYSFARHTGAGHGYGCIIDLLALVSVFPIGIVFLCVCLFCALWEDTTTAFVFSALHTRLAAIKEEFNWHSTGCRHGRFEIKKCFRVFFLMSPVSGFLSFVVWAGVGEG